MGKVELVDLKSNKDKRKEFAKSINFEGEIVVPNIQKSPERIRLEQEKAKQQRHESIRYDCKKIYRALSKGKQRELARKKLAKKIKTMAAISIMSITTLAGAGCAYHSYAKEKSAMTIEQILENGKTVEDLGVKEDTINEIVRMQEIFEKEEITEEDLMDLANNLPKVQKEVLKQKIGNAVGVKEENITLHAFDGVTNTCVMIDKKGTYETENMINQLMGNTVSHDVVNYIDEIVKTQSIASETKQGNIGKAEAESFYKKAVEKLGKVATWNIEMDKKGNLIVEKNYKENQKEEQKQEEEIERD